MITSIISHGPEGYYIEWYDDESDCVSYWRGSKEECEDRVACGKHPSKDGDVWHPMSELLRIDVAMLNRR